MRISQGLAATTPAAFPPTPALLASTTITPAPTWARAITPAPYNPTPPASSLPPPPGVGQIALVILGAGILILGLMILVRARRMAPGSRCEPPLPILGPIGRSSLYPLAVCVIVLGYHVAAWTVPAWLPLHIPGAWWWMLALGITLAILGTLLAERIERHPPGSVESPPADRVDR